MKIQFASDLHLEFRENKEFLLSHPLLPKGEILVLAGDIVPLGMIDQHGDFFDYVADHFEKTYWVPGNHEYYHYDITKKPMVLQENIRSNVHLVNNTTILRGDIRLVLSTLWSNIHPARELVIEKSLTDFRLIKFRQSNFTSHHFNALHKTCLDFISNELDKKHDGTTIVVTHHVPTFLHYPEQYKTSELNDAFAVELSDFIKEKQPDYWIYGHHHSNTPDFEISKTQLLTNQLGYIKLGEQTGFKNDRVITIDDL